MKKNTLFVALVLLIAELYSHECLVRRDSNLYGKNYPFKISDSIGKIKKNEIITFDKIELATFDIEGEKNYLNTGYSNYIYITTSEGKQGYISLLNLKNINNFSIKKELKENVWTAKYELDVLHSKNKDMVEKFNPIYAHYDEWRKYTDWQEDKWYDVYTSPFLLLSDSIIYLSDRQYFNGFVSGYIDRIDNEKKEIVWICLESKDNDYSLEQVKSFFAPYFKKGETYIFTYSLDGDYLTIFLNGKRFYDFVKVDAKTGGEISNLIFPINSQIFNEKNITWPRHADGTCDYDESKKAHTATKPAAISSTQTTNVAPNKTMTVKENLKLRSGEAATTSVLAVMSTGTKVKILALGKQAGIDGITSNWVQVEVQAGKEHRHTGKESESYKYGMG